MCRHTIQRHDFHAEMGSSRQIKRAMIFQFHLHVIKSSIFACSIKSNFMGRPKELLPNGYFRIVFLRRTWREDADFDKMY